MPPTAGLIFPYIAFRESRSRNALLDGPRAQDSPPLPPIFKALETPEIVA
jgi:hypothetical protein